MLGLFDLNKDLSAFKLHLRDFLIQLKEFSEGDNSELYLEEKEKVGAAHIYPCIACVAHDTDLPLQEIAKHESEKTQRELNIPGMVPQYDSRRQMDD